MAINFLNNINLNSIQVENIVIEKFASDAAAGTGVVGQLYFDTTADTLKQYVSDTGGGAAGWAEVGSTSVKAGTGIGVTFTAGEATVRNTGLVTVLDGTFIDLTKQGGGDNTQLTADLSAVDGTSTASDRFLTKNNKWATIPFGDITEVQESTVNNRLGIDVVNPTGPIPVVGLDIVGRTNLGATPAGSDELLIYDTSTTTNKAVTVSNLVGGFETTYTLPVTAGSLTDPKSGIITLTGTDGTTDPVTFVGTTGRVEVAGNPGASTITVDLTDDVIIVDDLTVGGVITQTQTGELNTFSSKLDMGGTGSVTPNKIINLATGTAATDAVNLGQVELLVAGVGVFKGGYNATTDPGVPVISGGSNIALDQGDYFVVSHDGDITFSGVTTSGNNSGALTNSTALVLQSANTNIVIGMTVTGTGVPSGVTIKTVTSSTNFVLSGAITIPNATSLSFSNRVVKVEVGDFIFANAAITASSDPAASAYTIVQSDANIAGAGATDGATEKGVAGFDSASFDVSASGWVQLNSQRNPYGVSQTLDNTSPVARVEANGLTTFTIDLADASLFGTGALAKNVTAEVTQNVSPYQTVYADVTRSGSASMSVIFSGSVAVDIYRVLLTHI